MENKTNTLEDKATAVIIRPARIGDLPDMAALYSASFPEHILVHRGLLNNPEYLEKRIASPDERWAVAESGARIVGVAALALCLPIGLGEIERVCVDTQYRGKGIGSMVCRSLLESAKECGLGFVEAFARGTQPGMQRSLEKLCFKVYGVAPRFEVMHGDRVVREQFVHMGIELKPGTIDNAGTSLIPAAEKLFKLINHEHIPYGI